MVQFVGREAKYRWVILRTGRSGPITIQSLPGQAALSHSLPFSVLILMYWLQRNVVVASMVCVHEHFLHLLSGPRWISLDALQRESEWGWSQLDEFWHQG